MLLKAILLMIHTPVCLYLQAVFLRQLFALILALCLFSTSAKSSHILGAEFGWQYLGSDTYLIYVDVYRDCGGIYVSTTPITIYSGGGNYNLSTNFLSGPVEITPLCSDTFSQCYSGSSALMGVERYRLGNRVNLKAIFGSSCQFDFVWEQCCRSGAITTFASSSGYLKASVNFCDFPGDNSPIFASDPLITVQTNECVIYNLGWVDPDQDEDSVVFSLTPALDDGGAKVKYVSNFSATEPLTYGGSFGKPAQAWDSGKCLGFHLDSSTGEMKFKGTKEEVAVIAVKAEQYRKDASGTWKLASQITREFNVIVKDWNQGNAANGLPEISGFNGSFTDTLAIGLSDTAEFTVYCIDPDRDTAELIWSNPPPGATITQLRTDTLTIATIRLKLTTANLKSGYFPVYLEGRDRNCPIAGRRWKTLWLKPSIEDTAFAAIPKFGCTGTPISFISTTANAAADPARVYRWTFGDEEETMGADTIMHAWFEPGAYPVRLSITSTKKAYHDYLDTIQIIQSPHAAYIFPDSVCTGEQFSFGIIDSTLSDSLGSTNVLWAINTDTIAANGGTYNFDTSGVYSYALLLTGPSSCQTLYTGKVQAFSTGKAGFTYQQTSCTALTVAFASTAVFDTASLRFFQWDFGDSSTIGTYKPSHTYPGLGIYPVTLTVGTLGGCITTYTDIVVIGGSSAQTYGQTAHACVGEQMDISALLDSFAMRHGKAAIDWGDGQGLDTSGTGKHVYARDTLSNALLLGAQPLNGCTDTLRLPIAIHALPQSAISASVIGSEVSLAADSGFAAYYWLFSDGGTASGQLTQYSFDTAGRYRVTLTITDSFGCSADTIDEIEIIVGIAEHQPSKLMLFPNPVSAGNWVRVQPCGADDVLQVYSPLGQLLSLRIIKQGTVLLISTEDMKPGVFVLRLQSASGIRQAKLIVH